MVAAPSFCLCSATSKASYRSAPPSLLTIAKEPMAISVVASNLATVSVVGLLYGIFFALFCVSTFLLVRRSREAGPNGRPFYTSMPFIGGTLLFSTVTPHWIIIVYRSFMAFLNYEGGTMPIVYYSTLDNASNLASTVFTIIVILIADSLIIYRLWVLWDYNRYVIILPILLSAANVVCGVGETYVEARFPITDPSFVHRIDPWITSSCVQTLATNIYCCAMISWKLWSNTHPHKAAGLNVRGVAIILVESAGLYAVWTIVWFSVYESGSAVEVVLAEGLIPVTGIAFMLINVRVGLGYAIKSPPTSSTSPWKSYSPRTTDPENNMSFAMPVIAIDMSRTDEEGAADESSLKFAPVSDSLEHSRVYVAR